MSQRNLSILILGTAVCYVCYVRGDQNSYARYVAEGLTTIDENALDRVPDRELFEGAMRGMVDVLNEHGDLHSEFLDEDEAEPLVSEIRQQFGGIGVRIGFEGEPERLTIVGPPEPGSPAARENLRAGDQIKAIDGQTTEGMKMADVLRFMRGAPGSELSLTIVRAAGSKPGQFEVELVREVINIESVLGDRRGRNGGWQFRLESDPRIAQVRIVSFGERTALELDRVLTNAVAQGAKAVALDLRGDAGGSLDAAVAVCQILLPAGKEIVETRGRENVVRDQYATIENGKFLNVPLVVLVNQDSASASEIVAACLQDNHRTAVAGQRSYGKGTVQQLIPMQNGRSLLKLTWASFSRPNGAKIHRASGEADDKVWGVSPDEGLELRLSDEEYAGYKEYRSARDRFIPTDDDNPEREAGKSAPAEFVDRQLQLAIKYLHDELDGGSR